MPSAAPPSAAAPSGRAAPAAPAPAMVAGHQNDAQENTAPSAAAVVSTLSVELARWNADKETLEVRGTVSSPLVKLSAEFLDRSETLTNDQGKFRAEFSGVRSNPSSVVVLASDGARANSPVEED